MVRPLAHCDDETAVRALEAAGGGVKLAVLLARGLDLATAEALIRESRGHLRSALARLSSDLPENVHPAQNRAVTAA